MKDNFCPAPWVSRFLNSNKFVTPCCYTTEQNINELKQKFSAGEKPKQCYYCWGLEAAGNHSPRQDLIEFTNNRKEFDAVELLSINLGNYCNAECITCFGHGSSRRNTWAKKHNQKEYTISAVPASELDVDFAQYPSLRMLTLIGGEPTVHPDTKPLLNKLINIGIAKNIVISFNTNASKIDPDIMKLLTEFKGVFVTLSIDGAGKYFEYQRRPLEWTTVKSNAEQWMLISADIVINYVVTAISIWGFNEFVAWYEQLPVEIRNKTPKVTFTQVAGKPRLSLNVLTSEQRAQWGQQATPCVFKNELETMLNAALYQRSLVKLLEQQILIEDTASKIKFAELFPTWTFDHA
jgi:sulfatase maturation enzyme AslB (radical SAM superfamily)